MHLYKRKKGLVGPVLEVLLFIAVFTFFMFALADMSHEVDEGEVKALKVAIDKAITTCYAIEGQYPDDIEYLEENYGIVIDDSKFVVDYDKSGQDIKPNVKVSAK